MTNPEHFTDQYLTRVANGGTAAAPIARALLLLPLHLRQEKYDIAYSRVSAPASLARLIEEAFEQYQVETAWPRT